MAISAREAFVNEVPRPAEVAGPALPTIDVGGQQVELLGVHPCQGCRAPSAIVGVRRPGIEDKYGTDRLHGRTIQWQRGQFCPACTARRLIASRPVRAFQRLDPGVKREDIRAAADHQRSLGSSTGALRGEVLDEILAGDSRPRVSKAVLRAHPFHSTIEPITASLDDDPSPEGAMFRVGPTRWGSTIPETPVPVTTLLDLLDGHALGDLGLNGLVAPPGEAARFALALGTPGEQAGHALETGRGVICSRYPMDGEAYMSPVQPPHRFKYHIDLYTFIESGQASTTIVIDGGQSSGSFTSSGL